MQEEATADNRGGNIVHAVENPDLRTKVSANGRSFWTIDEGWDIFWPNPDGTIADRDRKACEFLAPR